MGEDAGLNTSSRTTIHVQPVILGSLLQLALDHINEHSIIERQRG